MKTILTILITAVLATGVTWFYLRGRSPDASPAPSGERKLLYYQSAMHPWIKSDKPGRCTICGMELTPVYEGEQGFDEAGGDAVVALTQSQIQVLHVRTEPVATRPLVRGLRVAGVIGDDATRRRVMSAYIDGRIDKLHVNFIGAEVREGQALAELYSPALLQAEREYRQLAGDLKRNTGFRLLQMGLTPAQLSTLDAKPVEELTSAILAPVSGTVVARSVYEGQYVATGEPLFEIADFSTMWFLFDIYEQDIPWIREGLTVQVTTPSIPGRTIEGRIGFIDPNFDEITRSTEVRVELPNPLVDGRRELLHRLYADGLVELDAPAVLSVSRSAVIQTGPQAVAYVDLGEGAYEQRLLTLGRRGDTHVEVLSGLAEGEQVVTNGNLLIDGQAEMNRAFMAPPEPVVPVAEREEPSEAQQQAVAGFLEVADAMSLALSVDDLAQFNTASEAAMMATGELIRVGRDLDTKDPGGQLVDGSALDALDKARHFHGFEDIKTARIAFHRFSVAAVAVIEPLRAAGLAPGFEMYECGMVDEAIPGVPPKARWIQTAGRALANPFFGAEMLQCGKKIRP